VFWTSTSILFQLGAELDQPTWVFKQCTPPKKHALTVIARRLVRTNLTEAEVGPMKESLAQSMFDHIPVGVGSQGDWFTVLLL